MEIPLYQVDAFARRQFGGNPAAVCPLTQWLPDQTLQSIAAENNLAETAYFVREGKGVYRLRWFTPTVEVDLCGHATLAAAYVLWSYLRFKGDAVCFNSRSGPLMVTRSGTRIILDFPVVPARRVAPPLTLIDGLGVQPLEVWGGMDFMVVLPSEEDVRTLQPAWEPLAQAGGRGVIVTAPGSGKVDFVSRFFAPAAGINEDPVTGSAHCMLTPYWAQRLGKKAMYARQLSARGGELWLKLKGDRVLISGQAQPYLKGAITLAG